MSPPGVPALANAGIIFNKISVVVSDIKQILNMFSGPQWGIFDQIGSPIIIADSTLAFELTRDSNVSKYPVEQGGFSSYNKVQAPRGIKFTFTKGGTTADKTRFLNSIETAQNSLELFVGLTPEVAYKNISIDHYDLRRTSKNGVSLITVDVWCEEIRQAPALQFSNTSNSSTPPLTDTNNPESANPINGGTVQAISPSSQVSTPMMVGSIPGSGIVSPATITSPEANFINSLGNAPPPSVASPIGSSIIWDNAAGTGSGSILSATTSGTTGAITGYGLTSGLSIPVNQVTNIFPQGFTVVQ